ncbi:MAG: phage Gp37/Gp68 family protein [Gemmataceae bacterium]|nr:phage Gp37/Gp68 family protein [Gemmataceae bacterium]
MERSNYTIRIGHLRQTGAATRFLSLEPLLGPLPDLDLSGIDWVIDGGELGPGARLSPRPQGEGSGVRANASPLRFPSFSSNGAASSRNAMAARWKAGRGRKCRP